MDNDNPPPYFPIAWDVEEGKNYNWCGCGLTTTPPFCDRDREECVKRFVYSAPLTDTVYFCHCKQTKDPPFCDGSHAKLLREMLKNRKSNET